MTAADVLEPSPVRSAVSRLAGLDVARALAMLGMFVVHIDVAGQGFPVDGVPTQTGLTVASFLSGRAMPLFVVLSGVGLTLLLRSRGGRPASVLGRAGVLLLLGALLSGRSGGIAIILHFYALYLVVGLLAHRLGNRALLALAVAVAVVGVAAQVAVGAPEYTGPGRSPFFLGGFEDLAHPVEYVKDLLVTGAYPLFPDGAFFLAGMWVGRLRLGRVRSVVGVAVAGALLLGAGVGLTAAVAPLAHRVTVVSLAQQLEQESGGLTPEALGDYAQKQGLTLDELATSLRDQAGIDLAELTAAAGKPLPSAGEQMLVQLTGYEPHDHLPAWLLQAVGGSLLVTGLCLLFVRAVPVVGRVLVVGRYALSLYVAHWALLVWVDVLVLRQHGLATAVALWLAFVGLAFGWSRWSTTGPVEWLVRRGGRLAAAATDAVRARRAAGVGV